MSPAEDIPAVAGDIVTCTQCFLSSELLREGAPLEDKLLLSGGGIRAWLPLNKPREMQVKVASCGRDNQLM